MFAQNPGTGFTIWLTGMHAAGKRSLAREINNRLRRLERPVEYLDGPEWDQFIGRGPGDTKEDRNAITRRAGFVAKAITRAGGFVIVAQISPYRETREGLRREIGRFLEVFVDCPIDTLMSRDSSGQYAKAMRGEIRNFIGVTDPYEPPAAPEVRYDSSKQSIDDGASMVLEALVREGSLEPADVGLAKAPKKIEKKKGGRKPAPPAAILFTADMLAPPKHQAPPPPKVPSKSEARPAPRSPSLVPTARPDPTKGIPVKAIVPVKAAVPVKGAVPAKAAVPVKGAAPAKAPAAPVKAAVPVKGAPAKAPVAAAKAPPAPVKAAPAAKAAPAKAAPAKAAPAKAAAKAPAKPAVAAKKAAVPEKKVAKVAAKSAPKKVAAKTAKPARKGR